MPVKASAHSSSSKVQGVLLSTHLVISSWINITTKPIISKSPAV